MSPRSRTFAAFVALLVPLVAVACMWDYDTIRRERTRFPGTLELITGKFLRHSPEFYEWRVNDRTRRLAADPANVALLDDLAVAYDKTGRHDLAIETARRTELLRPGRYETAANLGTFHLHAGQFAEGLPHIGRALAINPDAHFGRERVQQRLAEYVVSRKRAGALPLADVTARPPTANEELCADHVTVEKSFAHFLSPATHGVLSPEESAAAVKGVLGMIAFGTHDSPVLLEALGGCLTQGPQNREHDAKLLAARAYLKASYGVPDGPARADYRALALHALDLQTAPGSGLATVPLDRVEADFARELDEGREWYAALRERELAWIRDGLDPEAEFNKLYAADPEVAGMDARDPMHPQDKFALFLAAVGVALALGAVATLAAFALLVRRSLRRRAARRADESVPAL